MGAIVLTKVHGPAKSQIPWTLWVLGLSDFTYPWIFAKTILVPCFEVSWVING